VRHLAIEATRLVQEKRGIARYVRNVVRELASQHPTLRFTFFTASTADEVPLRALLRTLHPTLDERAEVAPISELRHTRADVVWYAWNFITEPAEHAARVVTIHDLAPMLTVDGRWWKFYKRAKYRRRYERTVALADAIVTDSAFSRREMIHHLGVDPFHITVTLLAADDLPIASADDTEPLDHAGVTGAYFLFVGAQDGRKNLCTLYRAMAQLWAQGHRVPLVQCGPSVSRETKALLGKAPWLRHVGFVSETQLATLYRRATALVFPSCYEGFGLPVVEAMRVGTPVLCAAGSSLAEVVGGAALQVEWNDAAGFTTEMQRLLHDSALRDELRTRSMTQAAQYSWARTASETYALFTRVVHRRAEAEPMPPRMRVPIDALRSPTLAPTAPVAAASRLHGIANG
jgi:glycosyltransferase involved in cell wall biosynthesis